MAGDGYPWRRNPLQKEKARKLYCEDNASLADIAAELGRTVTQIKGLVASSGWTRTHTPYDNQPTAPLSDRVIRILKRGPISIEELSDKLDVAPKAVRAAIKDLQGRNYMAEIANDTAMLSTCPTSRIPTRIDLSAYKDRPYKFGAIGDTHLCSHYACIEHLHLFYDLCESEGVHEVFLAGNYIDGEARFNKQDIHVHGFDNQIAYFVREFPRRNGIKTHFIDGDDHEGWYYQREGIMVGAKVQRAAEDAGRDDLIFDGYMSHTYELGGDTPLKMHMVHAGGGSSYAVSYQPQKMVESFSGGEKPHILLIGHYHKAIYFQDRNVQVVSVGCFERQTPFMRKKRLAAHIGGFICSLNMAPDGGVNRFLPEWIPAFKGDDSPTWAHHTGVLDSAR